MTTHFGSFTKPIYLPSGGLSYPPYAWITPLTQEYILHEYDTKKADSLFSDKLSILHNYITFPVDILDIYISDIQYVWMYILLEYVLDDQYYFLIGKCDQCNHEYHIKIDLTQTTISYFNKYNEIPHIHLTYTPRSNPKITFIIELRRAKHNIDYGTLLLSSPHNYNNDFTYQSILYIATQTSSLYYNNEIMPQYEYIPCLLSLSYYDVTQLLLQIYDFNYQYGIYNKYMSQCPQCGYNSYFFLFNDLQEAQIQPYYQPTLLTKHSEIFKNIFEVIRLPIFNYQEYIRAPIHIIKPIIDALNNIEFHSFPGATL